MGLWVLPERLSAKHTQPTRGRLRLSLGSKDLLLPPQSLHGPLRSLDMDRHWLDVGLHSLHDPLHWLHGGLRRLFLALQRLFLSLSAALSHYATIAEAHSAAAEARAATAEAHPGTAMPDKAGAVIEKVAAKPLKAETTLKRAPTEPAHAASLLPNFVTEVDEAESGKVKWLSLKEKSLQWRRAPHLGLRAACCRFPLPALLAGTAGCSPRGAFPRSLPVPQQGCRSPRWLGHGADSDYVSGLSPVISSLPEAGRFGGGVVGAGGTPGTPHLASTAI